MKIGIKREVEMDAKVVSITAKCSDMCGTVLKDAGGTIIHETDGYVPGFFPNGGGDYVELEIDIETGKILNWKPPTVQELTDWIEGE